MPNTDSNLLSAAEEAVLTSIGYLVMRWNYAESCARQIIRQYVEGNSLADPEHLRLSSRSAMWIERQLEADVLPRWTGIGRQHLERLIEAYSRAREHRNHIVHGIYMTVSPSGPRPALAVLLPIMPKNNKPQALSHITVHDLRPIAHHLHDLAMFAREVSICFGPNGDIALNADGTPVLEKLPDLLEPIRPCKYKTI
jgi:hypothetical protein